MIGALWRAARLRRSQTVRSGSQVVDDAAQHRPARAAGASHRQPGAALTEQLLPSAQARSSSAPPSTPTFRRPRSAIPRVGRAHSVDLERIAAPIRIWSHLGHRLSTAASSRRSGASMSRLCQRTRHARRHCHVRLRRLGTLTGRDRSSGQVAAAFVPDRRAAAQYAMPQARSGLLPGVGSAADDASSRHVIERGYRLCGGRNVFADLAPIAPQVSIEAVLAASRRSSSPPSRAAVRACATMWRHFPNLSATRRQQFVTLDADRINRHGPRMADEITVLCEAIERTRAEAIK